MNFASVRSVEGMSIFWSKYDRRIQLLALAIGLGTVAVASIILIVRGDLTNVEYWRRLGYPGVFFISFLGSVSLFLPVPSLIAVCGAGGLNLSLVAVGLLAGTAETIGEVSGYAIGYGGRSVIEKRRFYSRVKGWMERRGSLVIFVVSMVPNPVFDIVGIAAGSVRFPLSKFLAIVWVGKTIKSLIVVHTCFWIAQLLPWIG